MFLNCVAKNFPVSSQNSDVLSQSSFGISGSQTNGVEPEPDLVLVTSQAQQSSRTSQVKTRPIPSCNTSRLSQN